MIYIQHALHKNRDNQTYLLGTPTLGNSDFSELKIAVVYLNMLKKIDL